MARTLLFLCTSESPEAGDKWITSASLSAEHILERGTAIYICNPFKVNLLFIPAMNKTFVEILAPRANSTNSESCCLDLKANITP